MIFGSLYGHNSKKEIRIKKKQPEKSLQKSNLKINIYNKKQVKKKYSKLVELAI